MHQNEIIKVSVIIDAGIDEVWNSFTKPAHIKGWNFANDEWHCPEAENDLQQGGSFSYRMEEKKGDAGFDFAGRYNYIVPFEKIEYTLSDGRKVEVLFKGRNDDTTEVIEIFEPETQNPKELQERGWQAILSQFKVYTESIQK